MEFELRWSVCNWCGERKEEIYIGMSQSFNSNQSIKFEKGKVIILNDPCLLWKRRERDIWGRVD